MGIMTALKSVLPWLQNSAGPWATDAGQSLPSALERENYFEAYIRHPRTRACIDRIADAVAMLPVVIEAKRGEEWEEVSNEVTALFDFVNPRQDRAALIKHTVIALILYGNAYWALERYGGAKVQEMWVLSEAIATIEVALDGGDVQGYKFQWNSGGEPAVYDVTSVINFCLPNPLSPSSIVGASMVDPIANLIEQDWAMGRYNLDYFNNGASPGVILSVKGKVPEAQRDAIVKQFQSRFGNKTGAHKPMVVGSDGGADLLKHGDNPQESSFLDTHEAVKADIAEALGVPESLLKPSAANYATAREDTRHFYANRVFPLVNLIECAINEQFIAQYGTDLRLRFDTEIPELLLDEQLQKAEMSKELSGGKPVMTQDEIRDKFWGMGPLSKAPGYEEPVKPPQLPVQEAQEALPTEEVKKALKAHFPDNTLTEPTQAKLAELVRGHGLRNS